jgi:hypothetical protein
MFYFSAVIYSKEKGHVFCQFYSRKNKIMRDVKKEKKNQQGTFFLKIISPLIAPC